MSRCCSKKASWSSTLFEAQRSSASKKQMKSPLAALIPVLRAAAAPRFCW